MARLIAIRVVGGLATLLAASVLIFATTEILPGDAATAYLGREATPEAVAALQKEFGLDRPAAVRYAEWISGVVRGDLGRSVVNDVPVTDLVGERLVNTAILVALTLALLVPLALVVGTFAALRSGSHADTSIQLATLVTVVVPEFVIGIGLILLFVYIWPILPAVSISVSPTALFLPTAALLLTSFAYTARMVRAGVIDVLQSEYVAMARLKGLPENLVVRRHILPNSLVPAMQALALTAAWMPGGIVIIEVLFAYPGVGEGLVQAVASRDTATVSALTLVLASVYIVANLISDIFAVLVTPRLRTQLA